MFEINEDRTYDTISFAGPVAAALLWIQEEVSEMEDSVFAGRFPESIDAVFDIMGIIVILMGWIASEFGRIALDYAYASYEWDQIKRGRDVNVFHQQTIVRLIDLINDEMFEQYNDLGADILINAVQKQKRRDLVIGVFARYLCYLNSDR
jgi:hypothetical protein